jgi:hypothetical protein
MSNPNTNLQLTVEAWADIVIDNWLDNLAKLRIGYYFQLESNLHYNIFSGGHNLPSAVEFSFPLYGRFVDMGVGRGVKLEDVKSTDNSRRPKKWYSKTFYSETLKLSQILSQKYARMGTLAIKEQIEGRIAFR